MDDYASVHALGNQSEFKANTAIVEDVKLSSLHEVFSQILMIVQQIGHKYDEQASEMEKYIILATLENLNTGIGHL